MSPDRRDFLAQLSALGFGSTLFPGVLWTKIAAGAEVTVQTVAAAEEIAGIHFDDTQRAMIVESLKQQGQQLDALHKVVLSNDVAPAVSFSPLLPGMTVASRSSRRSSPGRSSRAVSRGRSIPSDLEALAFAPVSELAELLRTRQVSSLALTKMYLARLRKYDPVLKCVVTLTEDRALAQATRADAEIKRGAYRGPLHGIPWGAKDLLAVKGYPTTWGSAPYKSQTIESDATVVQRLDAAGAVLVAKLTLGELAMGDVWFGGTTKNPWKLDQGSSGSSAGPASATAAGLVGFSIGSETLGSISSPSTRCGATGLRPTFGRVPRTGAMALSWTMDKLGPICRSVEDCALVLDAIHGVDGQDLTVHDAAFDWDATRRLSSLRVGYVKSAFDQAELGSDGKPQHATKKFDDAALDVIRGMGTRLIPVEVPDLPYGAIRMVLTCEAAAAFDDLTRSGRDKEMARQTQDAWPNAFRAAHFYPAVDYINAMRARTLAMRAWAKLFETVDVIVAPTFGPQLTATNLTGHPAVIVPNGFRDDGTPVSLTFLGGLFQEATLLAVARAYQEKTTFHLKHPEMTV
ncbi:MAG: amidase [Gemmatimonadaceae bacterium]